MTSFGRVTAAASQAEPRYSPQALMILALLQGHEYHRGAGLVHRPDALDAARANLRKVNAAVLEQVRTGIESMLIADRIDPEVAQEFSTSCDLHLDRLAPCSRRQPLGDPLDVDPGPAPRNWREPESHDPSKVVFAKPSRGPRGYRMLDPKLVRDHVFDVGEVR